SPLARPGATPDGRGDKKEEHQPEGHHRPPSRFPPRSATLASARSAQRTRAAASSRASRGEISSRAVTLTLTPLWITTGALSIAHCLITSRPSCPVPAA